MPFTYEMRPAERLVICRGWGDFDVREAILLARSIAEQGMDEHCDLVLDMRDRQGTPAPSEVPLFLKALRRFRGTYLGKVSVVTGHPGLYGQAPAGSAGERGEWEAFSSVESALAWIRSAEPGGGPPDPPVPRPAGGASGPGTAGRAH